jgi:hypothetical protein
MRCLNRYQRRRTAVLAAFAAARRCCGGSDSSLALSVATPTGSTFTRRSNPSMPPAKIIGVGQLGGNCRSAPAIGLIRRAAEYSICKNCDLRAGLLTD